MNKRIVVDPITRIEGHLRIEVDIENGKINFSEINTDLVENLIAFRMMAEKFEQMSDIESSLLAIAKTF